MFLLFSENISYSIARFLCDYISDFLGWLLLPPLFIEYMSFLLIRLKNPQVKDSLIFLEFPAQSALSCLVDCQR